MDYRREIDGLRALAVQPVILFHAGFETCSGGFVGVDVFFVISGYLITTVILAELEQGKFSIVSFYERRARRILPALFLVILICIPCAWFWLLPSDLKDFSLSLAAVSVFASNILFWLKSGYFDTAAELKPLLHTWSLAVEEQYYVLFPLFLMLTWRLGKRSGIALLAVVFVISFAGAQWASLTKPAAAFFLLPARAWELIIGAFAAFYLSKANRKEFGKTAGEVGGWLGVALIVYAVFAYSKATPYPGFYALVPTIGTALVILFATPLTTVGRFVGNKAFVGIGLISYSAYLWHQPLFAFARHWSLLEPSPFLFAALSVAALVLAYLSWRYVETPFRKTSTVKRTQIFSYAALGTAVFFSLGLAGHLALNKSVEFWVAKFPEDSRNLYRTLLIQDTEKNNYAAASDVIASEKNCRFNVSVLESGTESTIKRCYATHGAGVLIIGDSHAIDLFGSVTSRFANDFLVGVTGGGCRPHTPKNECQYDKIENFVQENPHAFSHIIYEQAGFYLLLDRNFGKGSREMFSKLGYQTSVDGISFDEEHIEATFRYLRNLSNHVPVTWFLPRVEPHISRKLLLKRGCDFPWNLRPGL
ncbi:MAG: acyltransferase family protein, partial [Methyloversatilis sp.]|nr:acyltransferase family protein [Methyloversatilis sp.]